MDMRSLCMRTDSGPDPQLLDCLAGPGSEGEGGAEKMVCAYVCKEAGKRKGVL